MCVIVICLELLKDQNFMNTEEYLEFIRIFHNYHIIFSLYELPVTRVKQVSWKLSTFDRLVFITITIHALFAFISYSFDNFLPRLRFLVIPIAFNFTVWGGKGICVLNLKDDQNSALFMCIHHLSVGPIKHLVISLQDNIDEIAFIFLLYLHY